MLRLHLVVSVVACAATIASGGGVARAQLLDQDTELARTYFDEGTAHYARQDYARAIAAFAEARRLRPLPELDYDIGRCHEQLDHPREALEAYQRYLDNVTAADNLGTVRQRIKELRARLQTHRRRFLAPALVAGGAFALAGVATGLVSSVAPVLDGLAARYRLTPTAALQAEAHALQQRANAGYGLFAVAGAVAIVDVALWIVAARRARRESK